MRNRVTGKGSDGERRI